MRATCKWCRREYTYSSSSTGTYCSNKCQQAYQRSIKLAQWLETGLIPSKSKWLVAPRARWIRDYLFQTQDGCCAICGVKEWLGKPVLLLFDHIDGNSTNNSPTNVRLICSNCDAQTKNYKGRNRGKGRKSLGYNY